MLSKKSLYSLTDVRFEFTAGRMKKSWRAGSKKSDILKKDEIISSDSFILGPISLDISKGKLTSILGRSGSGKTTLLSLIGLLRRPLEGEIIINLDESYKGAELWQDESKIDNFRAQNIGFALQRGELLPYLTLKENAELILRFLKKEKEIINQSLDKIFENLFQGEKKEEKFDEVINSKPRNVSQGQYQRGSIARSLANEPPILLADEPTGNLDQVTGEMAMKIFRAIVDTSQNTENPKTVIVVTHDLLLAIRFADEIIILNNGKKGSHYTKENEAEWSDKTGDSSYLYSGEEFRKRILSDLQN